MNTLLKKQQCLTLIQRHSSREKGKEEARKILELLPPDEIENCMAVFATRQIPS